MTRAVVDGGEVISPLADRIIGRTASVDVLDPLSGEVILPAGELIDEDAVDRIERAGIDAVMIRSVLTCESRVGVCGKCYGRDLARGTVVNIGEAVGVIAAQSIGEPGTQLTMRTFHIGGAAQRGAEQSSIEASSEATVEIKNRNVVMNSSGIPVVMGRNLELVLLDEAGREKARHRLPYGARLLADEGAHVNRGDRLAEWDPYTIPIITEKDGIAHYVDLIEGLSMREVVDEATGISSKVVIDWKQQPRGSELRPRITLRDQDGEVLLLGNGLEARYFMSVDAILSVENGAPVKAGDVLARIPRESSKTRDITGGLPRVAELFEARKPKDFAIISESDGRIEFGKDYKTKRRIVVVPTEEGGEPVEYLIPKGKHISVQEGDYVQKGDLLMDGNRVPHDILRILGVEALASYLVNEIQEVYRLQGVRINDKHIEVIVRQMLQKVEIDDPGETTLLAGEQVDRIEYRIRKRQGRARRNAPGDCATGAAGDYQGQSADELVHIGRFLPRDDAGVDRGRSFGADRHADRAEGKCDRRPADPSGHRQRHRPAARSCRRTRPRIGGDRRQCRQRGAGTNRRAARRRRRIADLIGVRALPRRGAARLLYLRAICAKGS